MNYCLNNQLVFYFLFMLIYFSYASPGDNSNEFRGCYYTCNFNNCTLENSLTSFHQHQSLFEYLFLWSCEEECKYECMWHATKIFLNRGWKVHQFYGKWPFIRICGLQEPASVLFSFTNLLAHVINIKEFRKAVPPNAPLYQLWHLYFIVCINAWFWSIIFHARDFPLSEKLDYFSAFSMVLSSFLMLLIRVSGKQNIKMKTWYAIGVSIFFAWHVGYLSTRKFDYGYNMKINVFVGLLNGFGWLWWSWNRSDSRPYLYWCRLTIAAAGATMFLELLDFPPLLWTFDAHALWHLSTSLLPFCWYRFVIDDCFYLLKKSSHQSDLKKLA